MPLFKIVFLCFLSLANYPVFALGADDLLPPDQAFKISAKASSSDQIEISWDIADGYYLYRNKIHVESKTGQVQLGDPVFPAGLTKHDDFFGDVVIYRDDLKIPVSLTAANSASSVQILVQYQGCADKGICYPPQKTTLDVKLPAAAPVAKADPLEQLVRNESALKLNLFEDELLPEEQAFQFFASVKDSHMLHVNWKIAQGYYLYREKIQLELVDADGTQLGTYIIPRGTPKQDEAFGQVEIFHDELGFDLPITRSNSSAQTITLQAKYQGCADRGVCYPPMSKKLGLALPVAQQITSQASTNVQPAAALSEQDQIVQSLQQDSLWMVLLSFFGFGL
ncbi:MAG: protein-disulfide reductase DsbD family protein, partial [Methylobacter sp.]|nr:protein-disulfide reductase DsbD family protein [Methylobacter sp.]